MNNGNTLKIRLNTSGVPDAEYYGAEARRLRGEYVASQLPRLVNRLKAFLRTKASKVLKAIVHENSVSA